MIRDNCRWVEEQFSTCELSDVRRTKRLQKVAEKLLAKPEKSLSQQNRDWADLKAAYRLFDQEDVTFDAVSEPHWQQVRQTRPGRYLLLSDTTDLNRTSHKATKGQGILGDGRSRGVQLHSCLMFDCEQQLLIGTAGAKLFYRSRVPENETRMQRLKRTRESELWGDLVTEVGSPPEKCLWVHVFDRGGDNFEAMARIQMMKAHWVIRAAKLNRTVITAKGQTLSLAQAIKQAQYLGSYELEQRSRPGVPKHTMLIDVSVVRVTFPLPKHRSPWLRKSGIKQLQMNVVVVQERKTPKGLKPVLWVLLTSLPAESFDDAWQIIDDYEHRWMIEEYHKVLKTGCNIEGPALRTAERLEPLISLIAIVGTRILQLKYLGRSQRDTPAKNYVPDSWLRCLQFLRPKINTSEMTVYQFFRELAKLGGFLGRKHDGEPGWETIWRGFRELQTLVAGMEMAEAATKCG